MNSSALRYSKIVKFYEYFNDHKPLSVHEDDVLRSETVLEQRLWRLCSPILEWQSFLQTSQMKIVPSWVLWEPPAKRFSLSLLSFYPATSGVCLFHSHVNSTPPRWTFCCCILQWANINVCWMETLFTGVFVPKMREAMPTFAMRRTCPNHPWCRWLSIAELMNDVLLRTSKLWPCLSRWGLRSFVDTSCERKRYFSCWCEIIWLF